MSTTLFNILHSELINMGKSEMFYNGRVVAFDDDHTFIKKVLKYDDDVELIVNSTFFLGLTLEDSDHDRKFKRQWVNKFLYYRPNFQTVESFASKVSYVFMNNEDFLNTYYSDLDSYLTGLSTSKGKGRSKSIDDSRTANSTLPQNLVNVDVDNTVLDYADDNIIVRSKSESESDNDNKSNRFDLNTLVDSRNLLEDVFLQFEKHCFINTW